MLIGLVFVTLSIFIFPVQAHAQPHKTQKASKSENPSPSAPPIVIEQSNSQRFQSKADDNVKADIRVISSPAKDRYDKAAFWANMILVLIGIGGIVVAIFTLCRIHRQAVEMKLQRIAMQRTLFLIRRQADLMEKQNQTAKDTERAILAVELRDPPEILRPQDFLNGTVPVGISMLIANEGATKAFSVEAFGLLNIVDSYAAKYHPGKFGMAIQRTIRDTDRDGLVVVRIVPLGMGDYMMFDPRLIEEIKAGSKFFQVTGVIRYKDIFGDTRETPFNFSWIPYGNDSGGPWPDQSYWINLIPNRNEAEEKGQNPN